MKPPRKRVSIAIVNEKGRKGKNGSMILIQNYMSNVLVVLRQDTAIIEFTVSDA